MIMFQNWLGVNPIDLSASLSDYGNKKIFANIKMYQTTLLFNAKSGKGLTQWDFVTLGPTTFKKSSQK